MKKAEVNKNHSYFYSLELEGINCFKEKQTLELFDTDGNYCPLTIILGDNGTGKTTLLKVLDRMQPINEFPEEDKPHSTSRFFSNYTKSDTYSINLITTVNNEKSDFFIKKSDKTIATRVNSLTNCFILSYGASRRMSKNPNLYSKSSSYLHFTTLFDESIELINVEEWYLQKYLAIQTSENVIKKQLQNQLAVIKNILVDFLPDVLDIRIKEVKSLNDKTSLEVKINTKEWIDLRDLSFGYQTTTALLVDIASKMMEQYPESNNPLAEPVIILIDEIDLHLHPKWQRTVIDKLSQHFPKAQFIVTAHSPLIVQAAQDRNANIVVCRKEEDRVIIDNNPESVKGWRIDQILTSDLFEVESPRSKVTQEMVDEYVVLKGKEKLTSKDKQKIEFLAPNIEKAYKNQNVDLDEKLAKFAEKYLK